MWKSVWICLLEDYQARVISPLLQFFPFLSFLFFFFLFFFSLLLPRWSGNGWARRAKTLSFFFNSWLNAKWKRSWIRIINEIIVRKKDFKIYRALTLGILFTRFFKLSSIAFDLYTNYPYGSSNIGRYYRRYQSPMSPLSSIPRALASPFTWSVYILLRPPPGDSLSLRRSIRRREELKRARSARGGALNRPWKWLDPFKVNFHDHLRLSPLFLLPSIREKREEKRDAT